ncbi:Exonuclease SbcC [Desulfosporosinus sp. BG]|nr:Exonuclease SbcC [Desulfosporosinus sp. BG]
MEIEDETGQQVSLPERTTLGEYLFRVKQRAFLQGGIVEWPENDETANLSRYVRNMRQGGDAGLSLSKVRASLTGAQKRVKAQTESMLQVKAEYDSLRREWEEAHRQQEKERLLLIEIKNFQEKEKILAERISYAAKTQERLTVLRQNLDYRELRQLQGELARLEERYRESESKLTELTHETQVDWAMIEGLREECMEWAYLQEKVSRIAVEFQMRTQIINETQDFLQTSGYQGLSENEVQRLRRAKEEKHKAQQELEREQDNFTVVKSKFEELQKVCMEEIARLQEFSVMAGVTNALEIRIAQKERYLAQWQSSKIGNFLDRVLQEQLGVKSIGERFSLRIAKHYQNYHALNNQEFTSQLKEFRNQRERVEQLQLELERLNDKVHWEEKLRKIINSRTMILDQAFSKANVADLAAWLNGWEDHQRKKHQLELWHGELQLELEQLKMEESKMAASAKQLREKLANWGTLATDRDEVLAAVLKVARQLRAKDEAAREVNLFTEKFYNLLGDRNMEYLAKILEPLADLERENHRFNEEKMVEIAVWQKEQVEIRRQLETAEQSLQCILKFPSLSVLEKKIETVKRQWMAYEGLHDALDDAQALLENSWQEWKTVYGKQLKEEKKWIFSQMSSSPAKGAIERAVTEGKRDYFAYRMAIAQLALRDNNEVPFLFSVGKLSSGQSFWEEVLKYLLQLSHSRQVVLGTSDAELWQKLTASKWKSMVV